MKGASRIDAATATLTWPDASDRKERKQGGRGDVPVWLINTNVLKDAVVGDLARTEVGPGYVHLPKWVDEGFFSELAAETRTDKGWKNSGREPNEAFDLHVYNRAACKVLKADKIDWSNPPRWARPPEALKVEGNVEVEEAPVHKPEPAPKPRLISRRKNWVRSW